MGVAHAPTAATIPAIRAAQDAAPRYAAARASMRGTLTTRWITMLEGVARDVCTVTPVRECGDMGCGQARPGVSSPFSSPVELVYAA